MRIRIRFFKEQSRSVLLVTTHKVREGLALVWLRYPPALLQWYILLHCYNNSLHYYITLLHLVVTTHDMRGGYSVATTSSYTTTLRFYVILLHSVVTNEGKREGQQCSHYILLHCYPLPSYKLHWGEGGGGSATNYIELLLGERWWKPQKKNRHQTVRGFCQTKATAEHFI